MRLGMTIIAGLLAMTSTLVLAETTETQETTENVPIVDPNKIVTESTTTSTVTTNADATTTVKSPPPSAISPQINTSNSDLCTTGVSGAIQTQILGISAGRTIRDMNCERLKLSKTLFDMGMKVAAVSTLCQDKRVFDAMMNAGTPCPYDGVIGKEAKDLWELNGGQPVADEDKEGMDDGTKTLLGGSLVAGLLVLLLL